MSKIPLYQEVYQKLKNLIRTGEYEVGDFLPNEGELEEQYKVSRTTIRKVINMLASEGYIEVKQGRGTRILDFNSSQKLHTISSITETLRKRGMNVRANGVYIDVVKARAKVADRLQVPEQSDVFRVQRVMLADETPIAIMENFIACGLVPGINNKSDEIASLYRYLEEVYGLHIDYAKDIISAKSSDFSEAQILNVRVGATVMTLRRVTYMKNRPITYDKITIRADKYQFEMESREESSQE